MARKFLTAIDLAKNELQNGVIQNLASAPSSPVKGQLYFNSTGGDNTLYWWDGTSWIPAKATGTGFPGYGAVPAETTFGIAKADGAAVTVSRSDHTHGSPAHGASDHTTIPLSTFAAATASVNMGSQRLINLATPTTGTDGTNKDYVDNLSAGLSWKDAVRCASTVDIPNLGAVGAVIDGVTTVDGDRVLVKNQTATQSNGIYVKSGGTTLTRTTDCDTAAEILNFTVFVSEGTQADTAWVCTANAPITVGTTPLPVVQFGAGTAYTAGAGLTLTGSTFDVVGDASITVAADSISRAALTGDVTATAGVNATTIANGVVSNTKLATMPATTFKGNNTGATAAPLDMTGTQATALLDHFSTSARGLVPQSPGGTGQYLRADGNWIAPPSRSFISAGVGGATSQVITHNIGSTAVMVQVYRNAPPQETVECDVERTSTNTITLRFAVAPAASEYQCLILY